MKKILLFLFLFVVVVSIGSYLFLPGYLSEVGHDTPTEVVVPRGASLNHVSEILYDKGIIRSRLWFRYVAQSEGLDRSIRPGTYVIDPNLHIFDVMEILQQGENEEPVIVTIPEGFSVYQISQRVEASGLASSEEFLEATREFLEAEGYDFSIEDIYYEMEGYLYPDTYHFSPSQTPYSIVRRMASSMDNVFTQDYLERAEELDLTVHEILTLASLIEREASFNEEKAKISGVIHNRLDIDMALQIDATVIYGLGRGEEHISRVLYAHTEEFTPFNTYRITGLPPGPIGAPDRTSIEAALYPEDHNYLYYDLGENGHVFSETLSEHNRNVANYRRMINNSGQ